ncbi:MAG: hypothetical protein AAF962_12150 [Actinomycetota bacterium]
MADSEEQTNPVEQLVELLVYAPIGLLYEYEDVLPKLVRRGRSQVQLARVLGQMAVKGRQNDPAGVVGDVAGLAATAVARALTDIGAQVGLAPNDDASSTSKPAAEKAPAKKPAVKKAPAAKPAAEKAAAKKPAARKAPAKRPVAKRADEADEPTPVSAEPAAAAGGDEAPPLPIAGYDDLTARQIIALVDELTPSQRDRIRAHEVAGRNRKTVLAKLDRLDDQ